MKTTIFSSIELFISIRNMTVFYFTFTSPTRNTTLSLKAQEDLFGSSQQPNRVKVFQNIM